MANFNIYIPQKYEPILEGLSQDGESIGQVIKRLVLGLLDDDDRQSSPMPPDLGDRLDKLEKTLFDKDGLINRQSEVLPFVDSINKNLSDRLSDLSDRLEELENNQGLSPDDLKRLAAIMAHDYFGDLGDRLSEIEKRLANLEKGSIKEIRQAVMEAELRIIESRLKAIAPPETAIMIQKQPLPPVDPTPVPTLTDAEVAAQYNVAKRTVTTWKKRPDLRPEDLEWDGESWHQTTVGG